ncbi:MAG: hypothetical protein CM1200mP30_21470 [Pseudomonadota bacterium]|nr:MAG: hypothetical protein CM1200mP30_21470 [Pseudomonadota bacterium]
MIRGVEVFFEIAEKNFGEEEYEMQINSDQVKISASHYSGYFYSLVSLLQLREVYNDFVPCGKIRDSQDSAGEVSIWTVPGIFIK